MRSWMQRAYLANSVNSVNLVILGLLSLLAPLGSENSHLFKWLFTKMVSSRESVLELAESYLMLKNLNAWICSGISSSFVGNNPLLHIHSFSEDRGKCNKIGNPFISYFTMLMIHILILADNSYLWSLQTTPVPPMLSFIDALRASPRRDIFSQQFS